MARPRISGVTNRITGITETMTEATKAICATTEILPKVTVDPGFAKALTRLSESSKLFNSEVNNCPAGQQCPVCTP